MKTKTKNKPIKVSVVWGKFPSDDFVLEPYFEGDEKGIDGLECFYIQKVEEEE